ncbi:MAG TPA: DUF2911 domain-containing protein [Longimicrobium sp.]|jgi:hypothetical protein
MTRIVTSNPAARALVLAASLAACAGQQQPPAPEQTEPAQTAPAPSARPAARPAAAQQPASPRDTAEIVFAERRIMVDYGRPAMRGRTIMGGLVPYGQVWRTGANQATHLMTQHDLRIGNASVPAGTYTLYTLPGESAWQLIVSRHTGQWGTVYQQAQDLARIPMQVGRTAAPVEQFTISLNADPGANRVNLVMEWENTRAWVPIEIVNGSAR